MRRVNRKKSTSPDTQFVFIVCMTVFLIFMAVIIGSSSGAKAHNNNVKTGEVKVTKYIDKVCDGKNLVYSVTEGIAVSPNDPQCY